VEWAKQYFDQPPFPGQCLGCGEHLPENAAEASAHRAYHAIVEQVFDPKPSFKLAALRVKHGAFISVTAESPWWLNERLYQIARMFKYEEGYLHAPWSIGSHQTGIGVLLTDVFGRVIGASVVRWMPFTDGPCWLCTWAWVAPPYRRRGHFRAIWQYLESAYPGVLPDPPFSFEAALFISKLETMPADVIKAATSRIESKLPI